MHSLLPLELEYALSHWSQNLGARRRERRKAGEGELERKKGGEGGGGGLRKWNKMKERDGVREWANRGERKEKGREGVRRWAVF